MITRCSYCGSILDKHETMIGENNPREGDISFCFDCGEASEFRNGKTIRVDEQKLDGETKKDFNEIRHAWLKVRARQSVGEI